MKLKKISREDKHEAGQAVNSAIEALERVPRTYGGHREGEGTSMVENTERDHVMHQDGRVMRFERFIDGDVEAALVVYRGRWLVVPGYKLRDIG